MSDVLARLMQWMETSDIDDADVVLRDAITEIAGLRARLHEHRLAVPRRAEQNATLTDAEREAIRWVCGDVADITGPVEDTLRGLLERLG